MRLPTKLGFSFFVLLLFVGSRTLPGQTVMAVPAKPNPIRYVVVDDYIRDFLSQEWDRHSNDTTITERGYCIKYQLDTWAGEVVYRVTQIAPPLVSETHPQSMSMTCAPAPNGALLHVHPPQTCINDKVCFRGGPSSYQCMPSDTDMLTLFFSHQPFAMIQCSREAVVPYLYPTIQTLTEMFSR